MKNNIKTEVTRAEVIIKDVENGCLIHSEIVVKKDNQTAVKKQNQFG